VRVVGGASRPAPIRRNGRATQQPRVLPGEPHRTMLHAATHACTAWTCSDGPRGLPTASGPSLHSGAIEAWLAGVSPMGPRTPHDAEPLHGALRGARRRAVLVRHGGTMTGSPAAPSFTDGHDWPHRTPFIASFRALGVCERELGRIGDVVVRGIAALHAAGVTEKPVVRRSPSRCIVQLGPVALTVTWLPSALGAVADGELLVAVWRGAVAPRFRQCPERDDASAATPAATVEWEDVLVVAADNAESWQWRSAAAERCGYTSAALADRCAERLRVAYVESRTAS
jgi:hypothetical protein